MTFSRVAGSRAASAVRIVLAAAAGLAAGWMIHGRPDMPDHYTDFDQPWMATRAVLERIDPFAAVAAQHEFPLIYPLTAVSVLLPLGALDLHLARAIFCGIGIGVLTWGLLLRGWWGPLLLLSFPVFNALWLGQWSPLLTGAALVGSGTVWFGYLVMGKPTIGLALVAGMPTLRAAAGAAVAVAVSLALWPSWPMQWLEATQGQSHILPPIARPWGFLLLLPLLRWRRPEARVLAALAVIPHLTNFYEAVVLFVVPASAVQAWMLVVASWIARRWTLEMEPAAPLTALLEQRWPVLLLCLYLPAVAMVLLRPNEGARPEWMKWVEGKLGSRLARRRSGGVRQAASEPSAGEGA